MSSQSRGGDISEGGCPRRGVNLLVLSSIVLLFLIAFGAGEVSALQCQNATEGIGLACENITSYELCTMMPDCYNTSKWNGTNCIGETFIGCSGIPNGTVCDDYTTGVCNWVGPYCFNITVDTDCTAAKTGDSCNWKYEVNMCYPYCGRFNNNQSGCEGDSSYFPEGVCYYDSDNICKPDAFHSNYSGSYCHQFDGNQTGCNELTGECVWWPESYCSQGDFCWDVTGGTNHGYCDPTDMNYGQDYACHLYDGNKTGCFYVKNNQSWACDWEYVWDGPLVAGTERGYCRDMFGGGAGGGSCADNMDETSCDNAAAMGMPCTWNSGGANTAWCMPKTCGDYDESTCLSHANESCYWWGSYCSKINCYNFATEGECDYATENRGLDCYWYNLTSYKGECRERTCQDPDIKWDQTLCEAKGGCEWEGSICDSRGCGDYGEDDCDDKSKTGQACEWSTSSSGWCEQQMCSDFDGNASGCTGLSSYGINCSYNYDSETCYEEMKECPDYNGDESGCYGTGYCVWTPGSGTCTDPMGEYAPGDFYNPGCWIFNQPGEDKCENVSTCDWIAGTCQDNGAMGAYGIQCSNILNSTMCNNIPMLSTCCKWNGTGCQDAPYTSSCWDNMQEPPEGQKFCNDWGVTSESICNYIAGDPWYMPCYWDNATKGCKFSFDDLFGGPAVGFDFEDIGSRANCEASGGVWMSEKWTDPATGAIYTDEWCEMAFGIGRESCSDACWACEFRDNGSAWASKEAARGACLGSAAGCVFHEDSNAFNGYGWCDMDWSKTGNCHKNCWECWNEDDCEDSNASCKWFTDAWNDMGWCDSSSVKTCDDDCYMCWDQDNCKGSPANCTWDTTNWFCKPQAMGGSASEVCFDGMDNDDDGFVDCGDPSCMFDPFCGGSAVFGSECMSYTDNETCLNYETYHPGYNCTWIKDPYGGSSWCDMPGAQCYLYDDTNASACGNQTGCTWNTMAGVGKSGFFCDVNFTRADEAGCWDYHAESSCSAADDCIWRNDTWWETWCSPGGGGYGTDPWCNETQPGWCDYIIWNCSDYTGQSECNADQLCNWTTDWLDPDRGWCEPSCFSYDIEQDCIADPYCANFTANDKGWCEPENMFKGCWDYDMDPAGCYEHNETCVWVNDTFAPPPHFGFCSDKFMHDMVGGMDPSPPLELDWDPCPEGGISAQSDICFLGIKDDPKTLGFGIGVISMDDSALCANTFKGDSAFSDSANETAKFYWYLDTDGNQKGGCSPNDDPSKVGYDLKFKYESKYTNGEHIETKVAYKCMSDNWSPSQIKLTTWPEKMCYMIRGGVLAVNRADLDKLAVLGLFNKSKDMRIYATTADNAKNATSPSDTIGPAWYSLGTADFKFEDCFGFVDSDGDGLLPEDDPDCTDFLRFGYIEAEKGLQCSDGIDNDGNGLIDCSDYGCMWDSFFCDAPEEDTKAPKITWKKANTMPDGAFIDVNTDEPTNATLTFFGTDSDCYNITNYTILDWKLENAFTSDDYDMWHSMPCDNVSFAEAGNDYNFSVNTTYYYKLKLCDKAGLCTASACTQFNTTASESSFRVGFNLPPPAADTTQIMGKVNVFYDWGGDGSFDDTQNSSSGYKINQSKGKNVNLRFNNPSATKQWAIDLKGVKFTDAKSINITDAFLVNETPNDKVLVGVKNSKWKEMAQTLGVDYVHIVIPQTLPGLYNAKVWHCPDNATELSTDYGCLEVNTTEVLCNITTDNTTCDVPTTVGFSVFGSSGSVYGGGGSISGGGGGGGGVVGDIASATVKLIEAGKEALFSFDEELSEFLSGITLVSSKNANNVKISVETLDKKPYSSMPDPKGAIYKYLKISTDFSDANIETAQIQIRVKTSWLKDNDINPSTVILNRNVRNVWHELTTTMTGSDDDYYYYTVDTPGFSYFSITADEGSGYVAAEEPEETPPPATTVPPAETPAPTTAPPATVAPTAAPMTQPPATTAPPAPPEEEGGLPTAVIVAVVLIVLAGGAAYVMKMKGKE